MKISTRFSAAVTAAPLLAVLLGIGAPASAQLAFTGTENGTVALTGPAFGSVSVLNGGISDSFSSQPSQPGNSTSYNFVDVFTFTYTGPTGGASGSAISFSSFSDPNNAITNLQAAVFSGSALSAGSYPGNAGDGAGTTGVSPVAGDSWTSIALGNGSATTFSSPLTNGTTYEIEVRGEIGSAGGSYGGNLTVESVPEPSTLTLMVSAMVLVAGGGFLRRRTLGS